MKIVYTLEVTKGHTKIGGYVTTTTHETFYVATMYRVTFDDLDETVVDSYNRTFIFTDENEAIECVREIIREKEE